MTVTELIDILEEYTYANPERADYVVKMVGWNCDGGRNYDIDIDDVGIDHEHKVLHLWDS